MLHKYVYKSSVECYQIFEYIAYMPNLVGIFGLRTYLMVTCEMHIVVGCVLAIDVYTVSELSGLDH